nr:PepSY-associated TM helix domain-containing protein [Frigidibacter oleivorans]
MPRKRAVFVRQVHLWHRLSGAVTLAGLLLFAASGLLLNHPGLIPDHARHSEQAAPLPADLLAPLAAQPEGSHPLPAPLADWAAREFGIRVAGLPADWDRREVFLDLPRPGGAAALILDRQTGAAVLERTSHGWLAYLADLHTGRAAGVALAAFHRRGGDRLRAVRADGSGHPVGPCEEPALDLAADRTGACRAGDPDPAGRACLTRRAGR